MTVMPHRPKLVSELTKYLILLVAFAAFLFAAYLQGGGTWRGPHNLRKSLPAKGTKIGLHDAYPPLAGGRPGDRPMHPQSPDSPAGFLESWMAIRSARVAAS
jgi:hypothetical protein